MSNLLITGLSKSGTTLLMSLLDGHKDIFMYPEEPYLRDIFKSRYKNWKEMLKDFKDRNPVFALGKIRYDVPFDINQHKGRFDELLGDWSISTVGLGSIVLDMLSAILGGNRTFTEKYSAFKDTNFFSLDKWFSMYPESKVMVIQRDLRANYASVVRSGDQKRNTKNLLNYISFWYWSKMYYRKAFVEFGMERIYIIDYEKLIIYLEGMMGSILEFLGIDNYENILLKPTCLGKEIKVSTATANKKEVYKKSVYRWVKDLTAKEKIILWFFIKNPKLMEVMALGRTAIKAVKNIKA